tara:strand:+ start:148 stop:384 length:237 start_codon:yes stop_codon:yes gene_type:complete
MKQKIEKWFLPLALLSLIIVQIVDYFFQKEINLGSLLLIFVALPQALKKMNINIPKPIEWLSTLIALIILIYIILALI